MDAPDVHVSGEDEAAPSMPAYKKRWMHFSDEKAVCVAQDEVLRSEAYMLFYDKA